MLIRELFKTLSFNELSNINIGGEGSGQVNVASYERLINITNNALLDLHRRFILSEKQLTIQSLDWKSRYIIDSKYAATSDSSEVKYIMDTPLEPYRNDLITIELVFNEIGQELPMNDPEQYASVMIPSPNCVELTHPSKYSAFFIIYRARHPELIFDADELENTLNQNVNIPLALEQALRFKIAAGIFSPMSGQEYTAKSQELDGKYEANCIEVESNGLVNTKCISTNVKLSRRGFI